MTASGPPLETRKFIFRSEKSKYLPLPSLAVLSRTTTVNKRSG